MLSSQANMSAAHICCFVAYFLTLLLVDYQVNGQLVAGGVNVCSRSVSYNTYQSRQYTRVGYSNYRTCCKRKWGVCLSRCTRYRTRTVVYYKNNLIVKYKPSYYCCSGWSRSGSSCPLPVCNGGCGNGKCIKPNTCQCNKGFQGAKCQTDIDECKTSPCQQNCKNIPGSYLCSCRRGYKKTSTAPTDRGCEDVDECRTSPCKCASGKPCQATCINKVGSFSCQCNSGFKLLSNGKVCTDINECSIASLNGCQHTCFNKVGSFGCGCRSGYELADDKKKCLDINECKTLNGGCMQLCRNEAGTFSCHCKRGFLLTSNKKTCDDVNECSKNPCDPKNGVCKNNRGSFKCDCQLGYKLLGDKRTCGDIDECSLNPCHHNCVNEFGSYKCTCRTGYKLDADRKRCSDINECDAKKDNCQHKCINKIGSFSCACNQGYRLDANGFSCLALPCDHIHAPIYGNMTCTGNTTGATCTFACNAGYNRQGDSSRQCLPDSKWSGEVTTCRAKSCPPVPIPLHGSVVTPCTKLYGSTCFKRCSRGYYMDGERKVRCELQGSETKWLPDDAVCKANTPCMPSPCLHSGKCSVVQKKFVCDCSNTGYTGARCEQGIIHLSAYPQLTVDKKSEPITVRARPTRSVEVIPFTEDSGAVVFEPSSITIRKHENIGYFTATAKQPGVIKVKYDVRGADSNSFLAPEETVVYASIYRKPTEPMIVDAFINNTCHSKLQPSACLGKSEVNFNSNCAWSLGSPGYITVSSNDFEFPLSFNGIHSSTFTNIFVTKLLSVKKEMADFLKNRKASSPCLTCTKSQNSTNVVNYLVDHNYFQSMALQAISKRWPFWFNIRLGDGPLVSLENIISYFGTGDHIRRLPACSSLPLSPNNSYVAYLPTMPMKFQFLSTENIFPRSQNPHCFAVDLCQDRSHISLPKSLFFDFSKGFEDVGLVDKLKITELALLNEKSCFRYEILREGGCVKPALMAKLTGHLRTRSATFAINGSLHLDGSNFETMPLTKFDLPVRIAYTGNVDYNINIKIGGKHISISEYSRNTEMYFDFGGTFPDCPVCSNKGVLAKVNVTSESVRYDTSVLRFTPNSMLSIFVPIDISGGSVIGIKKVARLKLQIRQFEGLSSLLIKLIKLVNGSHPDHERVISYHLEKFLRKHKTCSLHLEDDLDDFSRLFQNLNGLKNILFDLKAVMNSLNAASNLSSSVRSLIRKILFVISNFEKLNISYANSRIEIIDQGVFANFSGEFCFHKLCLEDAFVSIKDVYRDDACSECDNLDEKTFIEITPREKLILSKRVSMTTRQSMRLYFDKKTSQAQGYVDATLNLLGKEYKVKFEVNDTFIFFKTNLSLYSGFTFTVKNNVSVSNATWSTLVNRIEGAISDMPVLLKEGQTYFQTNARKTEEKQKTVMERVGKAKSSYDEKSEKLAIIKKYLEDSSNKHRSAVAEHIESVISLQNKQQLLQSYLQNNSNLKALIDRDASKICSFVNCTQQCVEVPICDVCQVPVVENIESTKCEQRIQVIKTSTIVPFDTQCPVTNYKFIPVYTGSCAIDPGVQVRHEAQLTGAGIAVGFAIGGPIGGLIGSLAGLFSSCDKSYEVLTHKTVVQKKCTLTRNELQSVKRIVSDCFYVSDAMQTGYSAPKKCNCKQDVCAAKISSPQCVKANLECEKRRNVFFDKSNEIPPYFTRLQLAIQKLQRKVDVAAVNIEKEKKNILFYRNQHSVASNLLKNTERDLQFARESREMMAFLLVKEICLKKLHDDNNNLEDTISIRNIRFDSRLPIINSIRLNVEVVDRWSSNVVTLPVLYDLNDRYLSIKRIGKEVVNRVLCQAEKKRRRRSLDEDEEEDFRVGSWYFGEEKGVSAMQKACVTFRNVMNFLNAAVNIFVNTTNQAIIIDTSTRRGRTVSAFSNVDGNAVLEAQNELLESLNANIKMAKETVKMGNVLKEIKEQLEVDISTNRTCLNFQDCVDTAFESLADLPSVMSSPRPTYDTALKLSYNKLQKILSYVGGSLKQFSYMVESFRKNLKVIESLSLHCAEKPRVASFNTSTVNVLKGRSFELSCPVESSLSVKIYWMKNNEIIDGVQTKKLEIPYVSLSDSGLYKCLGVSLVGNVTSNATLLVVYTKPYFLTPPSDVTYLQPSYMATATITCNITAEPTKPAITWYYQPFGSQKRQLLASENSSVLLVQPDVSRSGFYHCVANQSEYGEVRSETMRLDVLETTLATQNISLTVTAEAKNVISLDFSELASQLRINEAIKVDFRYVLENSSSKIFINISSDPNLLLRTSTRLSMMEASQDSRKALSNSTATFISTLAKEKSIQLGERTINVEPDSLKYEIKLGICRPGYQLDGDGFTCAQCPVGTYAEHGKCEVCPRDSYQPDAGQVKCMRCPNEMLTVKEGSVSKKDCVSIDSFCRHRRPGYYRHPTSCSKYIACNGRTDIYKCDLGLFYDYKTFRCRWLFEVSYQWYLKYYKKWWDSCEW